ncbi:hypothetical protein KXD93_30125 [Mucilaginibacter sp. BJC16-A38]|uniref:hypothetical protein n=1 Tax=Mucilaginibacter TaxID=423349 RepID=UPI002158092B|nr:MULTISPECIES: hypothetical protein [Mucilaginibacter]MCR8561950.1 hypothetical protein [Mucilaginibacter phenanthrenivorans]WDF78986.1 hypothetical protein PQ469_03070 [Mucilaginibacter sp. KACC 22773]
MDRINIKCAVEGQELDLQFDKKAMPGEAGPCFMISAYGCFKGYIARQKNGGYQPIGTSYYNAEDLQVIAEHLRKQVM